MTDNKQIKVLVVDDEPAITDLLREILDSENFFCKTENNPVNALDIIAKEKFDILLTDLRMPDISGIELIEKALLIDPDITPIVITGFGTIESAIEAMKKGATGYISKPFRARNIIAILNKEYEARKVKKENILLKKMVAIHEFSESISSADNINAIFQIFENTCMNIFNVEEMFLVYEENKENHKELKVRGLDYKKKVFCNLPDNYFTILKKCIDSKNNILTEDNIYIIKLIKDNNPKGHIILKANKDKKLNSDDVKILKILADRLTITFENYELITFLKDSNLIIQKQQRQLIDTDRMSALGEMAANLIHEIANPLGAIKMAVDFLNATSKPVEEEYLSQAITSIDLGVKKINNTIDHLRKLSKGQKLILKEVLINKVISDMEKLLDYSLKKKKISINLKLSPKIDIIIADERQIQQVLLNLILNAIDAMENKGKIFITTDIVDKENIRINIIDNGIGIEKDKLNKIFEPFYTNKNSEIKGTGFGLSIAKNIIMRHQGKIDVKSEINNGAEFIITLPIRQITK